MKINWFAVFGVVLLSVLTSIESLYAISVLILLFLSLKGAYTYKQYSTTRRLLSWIVLLVIACLSIPLFPELASWALIYLAYKGIAGGKL